MKYSGGRIEEECRVESDAFVIAFFLATCHIKEMSHFPAAVIGDEGSEEAAEGPRTATSKVAGLDNPYHLAKTDVHTCRHYWN